MKKILIKSSIASRVMATGAKFIFSLTAAALGTILTIGNAQAIVVGGNITAGTALSQGGIFIELTAPFVAPVTLDSSVGNNTFQLPNLYAFNEEQNIVLPGILSVDLGVNVAAGQIVASHYVFFDPDGFTSITGFVDFDAPIIGVATSLGNLNASDLLQNALVTYLSPGLRGLEGGDVVSIVDSAGGLPGNNQRLNLDWTAATPGDYVRVFTQQSPGAVPLPAALPLYGTGLAIMGFIGWRRKQRKVA